MSSPKKTKVVKLIIMGGVAVRPASDREEEFRRACHRDRAIVSSPIPRPASGAPHRFWVCQGPLLPTPPPRHAPINPATSDDERRVEAAAISACVRRETDDVIRPLLEVAASSSAAPKPVSPPRSVDDHYDLAKWGRRLTRWN